METKDYYKILGVDTDADQTAVRDAYRKLAFEFHPDRNKDNPQSAERMKWINEAYAVLSNPAKRQEYDNLRRQFGNSAYTHFRRSYSEQDIFHGSDIHKIFEEMAKSFGFRGFDDIFKEFYGQGFRRFEFKRPGFFAGGFIFSGPFGRKRPELDRPSGGGQIGRMAQYFLKKVSGLELPQDGDDTVDTIYLTPQQAFKGGPYAYYHRKRSKKLVVKIPSGVRHGQRIRLSGMGAKGQGGGTAGDLYLKVHIHHPWRARIKRFANKLIK